MPVPCMAIKKWYGAGVVGLVLEKIVVHCNQTTLLQKICCNSEIPLKPQPLPYGLQIQMLSFLTTTNR